MPVTDVVGSRRLMRCRKPGTADRPATSLQGLLFTGSLLAVLLSVTFGSQLPAGAAPGWLRNEYAYRMVWPQGWFFYSRVTRESKPVFYDLGPSGDIIRLRTAPQGVRAQLWGVRRGGGAEMVTAGELAAEVPPEYWTNCGGAYVSACLAGVRGHSDYPFSGVAGRSTFCGRYLIAVERPAAWSRDAGPAVPSRRVERAAVVTISCAP